MSIRAIVWAFDQECPSPAAKLVLIKLADHANDEGECWPSQGRIASDCGLARQTVNSQVKKLVELGLVAVERRRNEQGQQSNRYFLRCHILRHPLSVDVTTLSPEVTPPVISRDTEPSRNLLDELSSESSLHKKARARAKPRRGFEGWSPDEQDIAFATKAGRTRSWIDHQSAKCRDHHVAKGNLFADLAAAWRTWVRNAPAFENEAAPRINGAPVYAEPWEQRLAAWRKGSRWLSDQWGPAPGELGSRVPLELI